MIGILFLASFVAQAAGSACVFPTKYKGQTVAGCTTLGHEKAPDGGSVSVLEASTNECPVNSRPLKTEAECKAAVGLVKLHGNSFQGSEVDEDWPAGCYYCKDTQGCTDGTWFNSASAGTAKRGAKLYCTSEQSKAAPSEQSKAWCYTDEDSKDWRACTASDNACEFPFTYDHTEYSECTTAGHDQAWCNKVGGGWKNCGGSSPPSPPSGGFGKQSGAAGWVADHNHFRAKHGAGAVTWDENLAAKAQTWAKKMDSKNSMYHSDNYKIWPASGENLAWGYGGSCSAATNDGGPKLYDGPYDQHCVAASWYGEFYLWKGAGSWQGVAGIGHFTAMVWKGVDAIGCASSGRYYVCEYGSKHCMSHEEYGGSSCWNTNPSHLPNFNQNKCSGGRCVESLFSLNDAGEAFGNEPASGMTRMLAASALVVALATGAALMARKLRAHAPLRLQHDGGEELYVQE